MNLLKVSPSFYIMIFLCSSFFCRAQEEENPSRLQSTVGINTIHLLTKNVNLFYEIQGEGKFSMKSELGYTFRDNVSRKDIATGVLGGTLESAGIKYERAKSRYLVALMPKWNWPSRRGKPTRSFIGLRFTYADERFKNMCLDYDVISSAASYTKYGNFMKKKWKTHLVFGEEYFWKSGEKSTFGLQHAFGFGLVYEKKNDQYRYLDGHGACKRLRNEKDIGESFSKKSDLLGLSFYASLNLFYRFL